MARILIPGGGIVNDGDTGTHHLQTGKGFYFFESVAAGNTVQAPVGTITYTGLAPTVVSTEKNVSEVPAGAIAYTGLAPTIDDGADQANTAEIPAGAISYTGLAPTVVSTDKNISEVPVGAIAYTGLAPTIDDGLDLTNTAQIPAGAITYTGLAPSVVATEKNIAEVPAGAIAYTGLAPTVDDGTPDPSVVQVPAGAIAYVGYAPSVDDGTTPPVPYDVSWKGGGRILRKGKMPEWWDEWDEPQPKTDKEPPKSDSKERIAELAANIELPKKKAQVVPLPKKPALQKKAEPQKQPEKPKPPPTEMELLRRDMDEMVKRTKRMEKRIAALLIILMRRK